MKRGFRSSHENGSRYKRTSLDSEIGLLEDDVIEKTSLQYIPTVRTSPGNDVGKLTTDKRIINDVHTYNQTSLNLH